MPYVIPNTWLSLSHKWLLTETMTMIRNGKGNGRAIVLATRIASALASHVYKCSPDAGN